MKYLITIVVDDPKIERYTDGQASIAYTDVTYEVDGVGLTLELATDAPGVSIRPIS